MSPFLFASVKLLNRFILSETVRRGEYRVLIYRSRKHQTEICKKTIVVLKLSTKVGTTNVPFMHGARTFPGRHNLSWMTLDWILTATFFKVIARTFQWDPILRLISETESGDLGHFQNLTFQDLLQ